MRRLRLWLAAYFERSADSSLTASFVDPSETRRLRHSRQAQRAYRIAAWLRGEPPAGDTEKDTEA